LIVLAIREPEQRNGLTSVKAISIGSRKIGPGEPCFIIAEAGVNHNGDMAAARELVFRAKACGADCVKFQTFKAERVATSYARKAAYQRRVTDPTESQLAMLRRLELSESDHRVLQDECRRREIVFLSTPYSFEDAELLHALDVPAFKIASGQLVELPFLAKVARFNRPLILSTGLATLDEVREAVAVVRESGNDQLVVLQCTTNYPAEIGDANLRAMATIADAAGAPGGYSDHTSGIVACLAAVALGASVLEKHFTLDRSQPGPDQKCSSDPAEFSALVGDIRQVEAALGSPLKIPAPAELANLIEVRRSIVLTRSLRRGEIVQESDLAFKRPGDGLAPKRFGELLGRAARRDLPVDAQLQREDFE
jgi:N-acetylneuraminate synthase/N,N'-diacetyllegionaminate synthase